MGNDGGDIPRRKQLVKQKKKVELANTDEVARGRARFCTLTNAKMKQPLAICRLGHIYNYDKIIAALAQKQIPSKFSYIRKLSDIKKVVVERAPEDSENFFVCPITKLQYNGLNKFVGIWTCGHIFSKKAFKQIKTEGKKCLLCDSTYQEKDLIDLNLEGAELEKKRQELINKKASKELKAKKEEIPIGQPRKKVKMDIHINSIDRLDGEFRDVIRQRTNFRALFGKKQ